MALSRAKDQVPREAAQQMEMAQKSPMPKTGDKMVEIIEVSVEKFTGERTDEPLERARRGMAFIRRALMCLPFRTRQTWIP